MTRFPDPPSAVDAALRAHHADALARVSPRVRARLAQRRHAALRGEPAAAPGWGPRRLVAGAAFAAVLALGIARLPQPSTPAATPAPAASASARGTPMPSTILDEDPEFYAWLASADGQLLAME